MSDRLAVIQAEESIKEIKKLRAELPGLISDVKELSGSVNTFNRNLRSGNLQKYAAELQNLTNISRQLNQVNQQVSVQMERLSRIEANNARANAENARARRESAQAVRQETLARERAERAAAKEAKQNSEAAGAYKRLSQEANKVKTTTKNLEAEILILTRDFKSGAISQQQYNQELAKLQGQFSAASARAKQLDADLKRIDANVGDRQRNVGNYRDAAMGAVKALNSQITTMIASYAGFHAIVNGTTSLIHNNYELSDSLADLQIRLNGNKEATDKLFDSLRKIDTRTSLGELVNTASLVAKKGVAATEIEGITKALDDYFIVAGKEAGNREEGTASIIKLISIFNEDKHITADRVTEISTALVKLQNSGVATGSKMIDVAERIGSVRGITGVTLPQVLGFAAAIEQLGQKSEVAGTAGMQILSKVLSDMPKYAKMAGVSVEELRKAYSSDPFEAVVMVAQGVLKTGDFEKMTQDLEEVGVRGARVKGVLGDIATNADFVRKRIKDAGLAINEEGYLAETAGKKQETFAATIDKVKKEFELLGANDGFRSFIEHSSKLILGFIKLLTAIPFGVVITGLTLMTGAWAYYKGMLIQATVTAAWNNSQSLLGIVRNKAARLGLLGEAEAIRAHTIQTSANTMARGLNVASLESQIAAERAAIAALSSKTAANQAEAIAIAEQIAAKQALIIALEAEVVATEQATIATRGLNTATKASPLGIILGLLAMIVPLLLTFSNNTEVAAKKVRTLAENQNDLNEALDKGVQSAGEEVSHLDELYKKYTNTNTKQKERNEILKELQDYYPSYFGNLKTEKDLNDKLSSSYKELRDAIVSAARADAIRDKLKGRASERLTRDEQLNRDTQKEAELNKKIRANSKTESVKKTRVDGGDGKSFTIEIQSTDILKASDQRVKNLQQARRNNDKADVEEDKILLDMLESEDKKTAKLRKDRQGRLGKFASPEEEKEKKEKGPKADSLSVDEKNGLMRLEAARDAELTIAETKYTKGLINEKAYLYELERINITFFNAKIAALKGGNAKETKEVAKAELEKIKFQKETGKKIFDIEVKELDEQFKIRQDKTERQAKALENMDYLSDLKKLDKQIEIDNIRLQEFTDYYDAKIKIAKDRNQDTLELERKLQEESGKIQDERNKRAREIPAALSKQWDTWAQTEQLENDISIQERKRKILQDQKIDDDEKALRLSMLENDELIEKNALQIKDLEIKKGAIEGERINRFLRGESNELTEEEIKTLAELDAQIKTVTNSTIEAKNARKELEAQRFKGMVDQGTEVLRTLGFGNLADHLGNNFEKLWAKIQSGALKTKDVALIAAAGLKDALAGIVESQKAAAMSAIDEQARYSQDAADQELKDINRRIELLDSLGELTAEQKEERQRLESEEITVKEQQRMREKMYEAQRARAQQQADSQQALINGALAATTTLAKTGFTVKGAIQAAAAIAFGLAQSVAIMSRNPVPQYWKGRSGGRAEWAETQERGREIIADENDNIISLGSDKGSQKTWLNKGDKVYTAEQTKNILRNYKELPKIGQKVFHNMALNSLRAPVVNMVVKSGDSSREIVEGLKKIDDYISTNSTPNYQKVNGKIIKYHGKKVPLIVGTYDLKTGEETWK